LNIKKIVGFAIGPIGGSFLGFITLPLTAWFFSVEDIGRIAFLQVIIALSTMLFGLGLDQAYVREYHERENKKLLWKQVTLPGLVLLLFCSLILVINPYLLSNYLFDEQDSWMSILVVIAFITNYLTRFFSLILRMQEKAFLFSMSQIWPKLINIVLLIAFVFFYEDKHFIHLLFALAISSLMACLVFAWNTKNEWFSKENLNLRFVELKPLLLFGMPLVVGGIAFWGLNSIDRIFLKTYSTFTELGIYSIATSFAAIAIIVQSIFSTVWAPTVYKWVKENKNLDKINDISWYLTIIIVFIISLVGLFANVIALVLPEQYNAVQYIVMPALIAPLLYTLSETTVVGIGISRKSYFSLYASLGALLAAILLNFVLTPHYGALGASISSGLAFLVFFVLRTEFSVIAWKSFPRKKMYTIVFLMIGFAIANAVLQEKLFWCFKILWLILLIISGIYLYKLILKGRENLRFNGLVR